MKIEDVKPVLSHFYKWEKIQKEQIFLKQPNGDNWKTYSWGEVGQQSRKIAHYLKREFDKKSKVGILSKNCAHWIMADLAIFISNHVSVPFYANIFGEELRTLIIHSEIKALFVGKLDNWEMVKAAIPDDVAIIRFPQHEGSDVITQGEVWDDLLSKYEILEGAPLPDILDLMTIMYTSGTTGKPKGVMLSNKQPAALLQSEFESNDLKLFEIPRPRFFSYLPLNHIAERVIVEFAAISTGGTISFVESLDTFSRNLQATQPHVFMAVPRIWTKFQLAILNKLPQKKLNRLLSIPIISSLIKKKIIKNLGFSSAQILLTGAAPISAVTLQWYRKLGIQVQEVYAMTENCGGCSLMRKNDIQYGTVGKAIANVDIKINEDNGEVLMKSIWVMDGYFKDKELTAEVIEDGYLHTGDKGEIDEQGYLSLTGRVKDTFKCSKGEFVVPGPIELEFESNSLIEQICVVGLGIPQPLGLIVLSENSSKMEKTIIEKSLSKTIDEVNAKLAKHEKLKAVVLMNEAWSIENEILTPTMKIKRGSVDKKYRTSYPSWFDHGAKVIWA